MPRIARRAFLATPLAGPAVAQPSPAPGPRRRMALSVAQCAANRATATAQNARHPYYLPDRTTRIAYNALVRLDRGMTPQPELATDWAPVDDSQRLWRVTLREGVRFHDGRAMTVEDVVASFAYHRRHNPAAAAIIRVEPVDAQTLRFHLDAPDAEFPQLLADHLNVVMPAAPIESIGLSGIGSGPFMLSAVTPNRVALYDRNRDYWVPGRPLLDHIELSNTEGQQERALAALRSGEFDLVLGVEPRAAGAMARDQDWAVENGGGGRQYLIQLPKAPGSPFEDRRVRQALALAVNREAIVGQAYGEGLGWVGNDSPVLPSDAAFLARPGATNRLEYLAQARALLAAAGHSRGIDLGTLYWTPQSPALPRYLQVLREGAREAGLGITLEQRPLAEEPRMRIGDNDLTQRRFHRFAAAVVEPQHAGAALGLLRAEAPEAGHWHGPAQQAYAALHGRARREADAARRLDMYRDMQRILHQEVPALLPAGGLTCAVRRRHVQGFEYHPQPGALRFDEVWRG